MAGLIIFTLFVMLGVNPINDRFGFRYWQGESISLVQL